MQDQISLPEAKRDLALDRAQKVSRALHDAARKARLTVRGAAAWQPGTYRSTRRSRLFVLLSALVVVVVPTLAAAVYFGLIASDQYQVEVQFSVKGREMGPTDALGKLTGIPSLEAAQDSLVVVNYVNSRAMVEKLQSKLNLRAIYSRPGIDYFSRLDPDEAIEEVVKYWEKRVTTTIDTSGIVILKVRAYEPHDALKLAQAVMQESEDLVNDVSTRSRRDALSKAQDEVSAAERRLVEVRQQVREVRNREQLIDPAKTTDAITKLIGELKLDQMKLQSELKVSSRSLSKDAPQMRFLKARLDAISDQIRDLEGTMTASTKVGGAKTLSQSYSDFDRARLEQDFAEEFYTTVAASLEKARIETERQQIYLDAFVKPVLPEEASFPRRLWNTFLVGLVTALAWLFVNYIRVLTMG